jgi:hypothetical protein
MIYFSDFDAAGVLDKMVSTTVFPSSPFSPISSTYVDVLNQNGGSAVQVSITKGAGTSLLVMASMSVSTGVTGNHTITLGVNDGTTDHDIARIRAEGTATTLCRTAVGNVLITGLSAGSYTLTLRVKDAVGTAGFGSNDSASLSVMEVA